MGDGDVMARIMMQMYFAIRFLQIVIPGIRNVVVGALKFLLRPMMTFWIGVPQATDSMANEWVREAVRLGAPVIWHRKLYYILRVIAFLTILAGWVVLSFITVWIVRIIF